MKPVLLSAALVFAPSIAGAAPPVLPPLPGQPRPAPAPKQEPSGEPVPEEEPRAERRPGASDPSPAQAATPAKAAGALDAPATTGVLDAPAATAAMPRPVAVAMSVPREWAPTSSKAPPSPIYPTSPVAEAPPPTSGESHLQIKPAAPAPVVAASPPSRSLHKEADPAPKKKIAHQGFWLEAAVGATGCTRRICGNGRHSARPGARIEGMLGGNIRGFVELGVRGGWARLGTAVGTGRNALDLYGIDPGALEQVLQDRLGAPLSIDLNQFNVEGATLTAADGGLAVRVHFVPRGRVAAFMGTGFAYQLFRARYETAAGRARLDFHGLGVPVEAGLAVYVVPHVSVGARFSYRFAHYLAVVLDHPDQRAAAPFALVQRAGEEAGTHLQGDLPDFWTASTTLRATF